MAYVCTDAIDYRTPVDSIINHETESGKIDEYCGAIVEFINKRKGSIDSAIGTDAIKSLETYNNYVFATEGKAISDSYGNCVTYVNNTLKSTLLEEIKEHEKTDLNKLRTEVETHYNSLDSQIKEKFGTDYNYDELSDDDKQTLSNLQRFRSTYSSKLYDIDARLRKLGVGAGGTDTTGASFVDTGQDDKNHNYGAEYATYDAETVRGWYGQYGKSNWEAVGFLGLNGLVVDADEKYANPYFKMKGANGEDVYIVCSCDYDENTGKPGYSEHQILFSITEDDKGHKICYDNEGNAIPYSTAMCLLDIDKCRQANGAANSVYTPERVEEMSSDGYCNGNYSWQRDSSADDTGSKWSGGGQSTFDNSPQFANSSLPKGRWYVYSKTKDSTKGNEVVLSGTFPTGSNQGWHYYMQNKYGIYTNTDTSQIFSVQVPDTSTENPGDYVYYYYDAYGNPITDNSTLLKNLE